MSQNAERKTVSIIGLGLMGHAFAERFLEAGFRVLVWNRTREKAEALVANGAFWSSQPLADSDRVVVCLYTTEVVASVLHSMRKDWRHGLIVLDTTTGDPDQVVVLENELKMAGVRYLEAPVSGSSLQARRGEATVLAGGEDASFPLVSDLLPVFGSRVVRTGAVGSASKMKLVTNLVLGLNRLALAEGLAFADAIGVDAAHALTAMKESMAYSRAMDAKGAKMVNGDYSVQARLAQHLKDVRLMIQQAGKQGLELPLSSLHAELMERAVSMGLGELDNSAILEVIRRRPESGVRTL